MRLPKSDFICLVVVAVDLDDRTVHFFNEDLGWDCQESQCFPYFEPKHPEWALRHALPPLPNGHRWERRVVEFDITEKRLVAAVEI